MLEPTQIILSDKSNRILKYYIEEESYATEKGKVIKDTVKKYN